MKMIYFKKVYRNDLDNEIAISFGKLLIKQGKVLGNPYQKVYRCIIICLAYDDNQIIGIGGIKPKTKAAFSSNKANIESQVELVDWELGYIYVEKAYRGNGVASEITEILVNEFDSNNLFATTETTNHSMRKILIKNNFVESGSSWKSEINGENLSLFLRIAT